MVRYSVLTRRLQRVRAQPPTPPLRLAPPANYAVAGWRLGLRRVVLCIKTTRHGTSPQPPTLLLLCAQGVCPTREAVRCGTTRTTIVRPAVSNWLCDGARGGGRHATSLGGGGEWAHRRRQSGDDGGLGLLERLTLLPTENGGNPALNRHREGWQSGAQSHGGHSVMGHIQFQPGLSQLPSSRREHREADGRRCGRHEEWRRARRRRAAGRGACQ